MEKVKRLISWFDRTTEDLKGEKDIDNIKLDRLREIFSPPPDDPLMIYVYPITEKEAEQLKKLIDLEFIFDKYIYQLDCFKADT